MKILIITVHSQTIGKANHDTFQNAFGLADRGHQVHLVTRSDGEDIPEGMAPQGVHLHPLAFRTVLGSLLLFPLVLGRVMRLAAQIRPEVILSENNLHSPFLGLITANFFRIPQGLLLRELTADALYHDRNRSLLKRALAWLMMQADHFLIKRVKHKLAINRGIAAYYEGKFNQPVPDAWLIGYDLRRFQVDGGTLAAIREKYRLEHDRMYMLYAGSLLPDRGLASVLRVLDGLGDSDPFHVLITGEGPGEAALQARVRELNLGDRVSLLGWVPEEDLIGLSLVADIGLEPYKRPWPQNMTPSTKMALYAAAGLFLLARQAPGYQEIFQDGINGFAYRGEDELREILRRLRSHPGLMASQRLEEMKAAVDVRKTTDRLEKFLRSTAAG